MELMAPWTIPKQMIVPLLISILRLGVLHVLILWQRAKKAQLKFKPHMSTKHMNAQLACGET